jgi:geranylgeranylglycerol-phosphate geranylgeranyltransferase
LVAGASYTDTPLLIALLVTFFVTAASMTINDYFDRNIDEVNHPNRPIPKGIITPNEMLLFSIVLLVIGGALSWLINPLCFFIAVFSIMFLVIYEVFSKQYGIMGNLTVAFISSISFTFGGAAVNNPAATLPLSGIAFFIILGREIIMDIRDVKGDSIRRRTLPMQIGEKSASYVGCFFLIIAAILTPLPFLLNIVTYWYLLLIIPVDIITFFAVVWSLRDINNAARSAEFLRVALAVGLVAFILGIPL